MLERINIKKKVNIDHFSFINRKEYKYKMKENYYK